LSKREKRLQKIRQNPKDVSMDELEQVLKDYGIQRDRESGSHYIFRYNLNGQNLRLSIPFRKPIKVIYVKEAIVVVDQIRATQKEDESDE
jgi:predicted RNA binding protein YcfA (HicA-like mRNA interferase family)